MGVYYNFSYVDLDKVKSPWSDDNQLYHFEEEILNNPILFRTMNNYLVKDCFDNVVKNYQKDRELLETLKFVFGNMFWSEILSRSNQDIDFLLNHWNLEWHPNPHKGYVGYLDWYSIHPKSINLILTKLNQIDLKKYFKICIDINSLNKDKTELNKIVIEEWIKMYELALVKKKGVVFDIG